MKKNRLLYITAVVSWLVFSYSLFFYIPDKNILILAQEDGVFETGGAIFFLLSAILFFKVFLKNKKDTALFTVENIYFFVFGVVFLFGFLEEISWGQRIFNLKTPQLLQEINRQEEINFHNITIFHRKDVDGERKNFVGLMLNFQRLFSIFWFLYCCLLPSLYRFNFQAKKILDRISFPIIPIFIGSFFILNYLFSKVVELYISDMLNQSLMEVKECNFAFLFFLVSVWFISKKLPDCDQSSASPNIS